jgi:AcrR family transcriptional regulator
MTAGLQTFQAMGYTAATVEQVRRKAGVSNGSFFHLFPTKAALAGAIFIETLRSYHGALLSALQHDPSEAEGIRDLIASHLRWVAMHRSEASFLFEQSRAEWLSDLRDEQRRVNEELKAGLEAWCGPLVASGRIRRLPMEVIISQLIGPAQIFCRAWLSGRDSTNPMTRAADLGDCAARALLTDTALARLAER